jgi:hypothetical protein
LVKIGFIVEGPSDAKIIRSPAFSKLLRQNNLELVDIIVPEGKTHFFHPKAVFEQIQPKVESYIKRLESKGAAIIIFWIDQDEEEEPCFTSVKSKIPHRENNLILICKRSLEAWYIADSTAMSSLLGEVYHFAEPETLMNPFETVRTLLKEKLNRGVGDKILLANKILSHGFSITNAAAHPNCSSARYFITKLQSLSAQ